MVSHHWRLQMAWKHHHWMPVTWYIFKQHPTCHFGNQDYPVIQASKAGLCGWVESWHGISCQKWMKLSTKAPNIILIGIACFLIVSGTNPSSKTPGGHLEDRLSLDALLMHQSSWNFDQTPTWIFWHHKEGVRNLQDSWKALGGWGESSNIFFSF